MKKEMLLALALGGALNTSAIAASRGTITISPDGRTVIVAHSLNAASTPGRRPTGVALFDNLAALDPEGVYTVGSGAGFGDVTPGSPPVELATAFTASENATVTEIDIGAGYISGTQNVVKVHLYQDAEGVPGTEIWSHTTALPIDGTCCAVAAIILKTHSLKLTAG